MTTTTNDEQMRARIDEYTERWRARLQEIADAGGLPDLAEVNDVRGSFDEIRDALDQADADSAAVAAACGDDIPVPFVIGVEHIAALSLLVHETREELDDLRHFVDRIERSLTGVSAAWRRQQVNHAS